MNTAEQIIMIILSTTLFIFLLLSIFLLVKSVQLINQMKRVADKAEELADNVEHAAIMFQKAAGPLAIFKALANMADFVKTKKGKGK